MRVALLALISALIAAVNFSSVSAQVGNSASIANDLGVLNYALALEALEATYYSCYLYPLNQSTTAIAANCAGRGYQAFSQAQFLSEGYSASVYNAVVTIAQQELSHQAVLNATIQTYFGTNTPVPRCPTYNLNRLVTVTNVATFLQLAMALENTGVSAYAGAVNALTDPGLTQVAVSIADVEARHAAWLNQLLGTQPFSSTGFDPSLTPSEIATQILSVFNSSSCVIAAGGQFPNAPRPFGVNITGPSGNLAAANGLTYSAAQRANDLLVLNYALTLEQLEASFYNAAGAVFNNASFINASLPASAFSYFQVIGLNENVHVATLRSVITSYGGSPVANCTYNFTGALSSFQNYLNTAQLLENTGVYAYTGAANMITDTGLQRVAATIAMIEARHAGYINALNQRIDSAAFPNAYDNATAPADIIAAVVRTGLVSNCPAQSLPVLLPIQASLPSSTAGSIITPSSSAGSIIPGRASSSSSGGNGASSTSAFSALLIIAAIIASLALVL